MRPPHIAQAFACSPKQSVFGPASDGGFWLIGARRRRPCRPIVCRRALSSHHALADTQRNLGDGSVGPVETLDDIDTADDLRALLIRR